MKINSFIMLLLCLFSLGLSPVYAAAQGQPFELLQQQINSLQQQLDNIQLSEVSRLIHV